MSLPPEVARYRAVSFDDWCEAFQVTDQEERERLQRGAVSVLQNQTAMRVLAEIEKNAIRAMVDAPLDDPSAAHARLTLVKGIRALRQALTALAQDRNFENR